MNQKEKEIIKRIIEELEDLLEGKSNNCFQPTKEQIDRWKKIAPTKKTIELLGKKGFSNQEIVHIKTQYDAHVILENLREENI